MQVVELCGVCDGPHNPERHDRLIKGAVARCVDRMALDQKHLASNPRGMGLCPHHSIHTLSNSDGSRRCEVPGCDWESPAVTVVMDNWTPVSDEEAAMIFYGGPLTAFRYEDDPQAVEDDGIMDITRQIARGT